MATKNITTTMYQGKYRLSYLDSSHRYYVQERKDPNLPEDNPKAWGAKKIKTGVTGIISGTLEKEGLMDWSLTMAMTDLFGFYDFTDNGRKVQGFKKSKDGAYLGRLWGENGTLQALEPEQALPLILEGKNASKNYKQKAADIGTVVHEAIEKFIGGETVDLDRAYRDRVDLLLPDMTPLAREETLASLEQDIELAAKAYGAFMGWYNTANIKVLAQEQPVYSAKYDYCGLFDAVLKIGDQIVLCDWKTSKASVRAGAPDGVYYTYLLQNAIYALALEEMGYKRFDDLAVASVRKDGGFALVRSSDLGYTVAEMLGYAEAVIACNSHMKRIKKELIAYHERVNNNASSTEK